MRLLLVNYDDGATVSWFPLNLGYLAAAALEAGHEVDIWDQAINHYPDSELRETLDEQVYDVVGVGVTAGYYQYAKLLSLSRRINEATNRPLYIIGGHGPSPEPDYFLRKTGADIVCIGESERTLVDILAGTPREQIGGIAYRESNRTVVNERRPLLDVDNIPWPAWRHFNMGVYRLRRDPNASASDFVFPVLAGRGCSFKCSFCYRMDEGLRLRNIDSILDEVDYLQNAYGVTYVRFADELLMSSTARTLEICERIREREMGFKWSCSGRLNFASPEVMQAMRAAGCTFVNYGIEAMDDEVLRRMHKGLHVDIIIKGVEATLAAGISPGLNIIWGNPGDSAETLNRAVEFLLKYDDQSQLRTIRPVTPYPGTELFDYAKQSGLISGVAEFYEKAHVNSDLVSVPMIGLSAEEMHRMLLSANTQLLQNYYAKLEEKALAQCADLYLKGNANFRGFRHS